MALEDTPITGDERCEECGTPLTAAEVEAARETGGPLLCSIHAAEDEPGLAVEDEGYASE
jgi:hypothetical protein